MTIGRRHSMRRSISPVGIARPLHWRYVMITGRPICINRQTEREHGIITELHFSTSKSLQLHALREGCGCGCNVSVTGQKLHNGDNTLCPQN